MFFVLFIYLFFFIYIYLFLITPKFFMTFTIVPVPPAFLHGAGGNPFIEKNGGFCGACFDKK